MKANNIIFCMLLSIPLVLDGQVKKDSAGFESFASSRVIHKPVFSVNIGSSYMYNSSFGGGMNMFAAPGISIPLSRRFTVEGGLIANSSFFPGFFPYESDQMIRNINTLSIFGSTIYQVSPNLIIYGTGIKQISGASLPFPYSTGPRNSFSFGSSLKIGKGFTIGASVHMSNDYQFYSPLPGRSAFPGNVPFMW